MGVEVKDPEGLLLLLAHDQPSCPAALEVRLLGLNPSSIVSKMWVLGQIFKKFSVLQFDI